MNDLLSTLEQWHQDSEYQKVIDRLEELSHTQKLDYALTCQLARAYNNIADLDKEEGRSQLERAEELLRSVADGGRDDPLWHYRLGYSLFYQDREKEALPCFQRALELDPEDGDTEFFIKECEKYIAARECHPEMYEQEDWNAVEAHMERYFGHCDNVFHEIMSPDIHVDIYIMKPTPERNYYVLSTFGMGAHRMNVPEELADQKLERAEIIATLPPDWKITEPGEAWYWPIRWLKILARLPINEDSWLGWGHTIPNGPDYTPICDGLGFGGAVLDSLTLVPPLKTEEEREISFYLLIPAYKEEIEYKLKYGMEGLSQRFLVQRRPAPGTEQDGSGLHPPDSRRVHQSDGLRGLGQGQGHHVRLSQLCNGPHPVKAGDILPDSPLQARGTGSQPLAHPGKDAPHVARAHHKHLGV